MVKSFSEDFSVTWENPEDGNRNWTHDTVHYGHVQPPLMQDVQAILSGAAGTRITFVNSYAFLTGFMPPPPTAAMIERGAFAVWRDDLRPLVRDICERTRNGHFETMSATELVGVLEGLIAEAGELFKYTIAVLSAQMEPAIRLAEFCERELGDDGPRLGSTLLQGFENETSSGAEALESLAGLARAHPPIAAALQEGRFDGLAALPGGEEFTAKLRAYLDAYGWRAESWSLGHVPTWAEEPSTALRLISQYAANPALSPSTAHRRAVAQREAAEREVEVRLSGEKLAEFRQLFQACSSYVALSEERAFWQLTSVGSLRVPAIALGRKLVEANVIATPNDVFFFHLSALRDLAAAPAPRRDEVERRRAYMERCEKLKPPAYLGRAMPPIDRLPAEAQVFFRHFAGFWREPSTEGSVIRGVAASKGIVTARARVIPDLKQAQRLQAGEILVCRSTSAPWTALFAIAGGVVTDSGGLLSHSAICAREYAIPCVVATQLATARIPDGAMITVDGDKGEVRLEG